MTELTPEQIADGWKITSGRIAQAFDTLPFPFQTMNFVGHISPVFIHGDGEPYWPEVVAYRTFSPDLPSPPVLGEAVKLPRKFNPNHGWAHAMQADEPAFLLRYDDTERKDVIFTGYGAEEAALKKWEAANNSWNCALFKTMRTSPITNEPVGQFDTSDYVIVGSDGKPRRNEPVGVTISRDDARYLIEMLQMRGLVLPEPYKSKEGDVLSRLSAAIGERG